MYAAPERAKLEALRVKPKIQWRPQEVRDVRNVECLSGKALGGEQRQPQGEALWASADKALEEVSGGGGSAQVLWGSQHDTTALDARYGAKGSTVVFILWILILLGCIPLSLPSLFPFGMELFTLCHFILGICNLFFILQRLTAKSLSQVSKTFNLDI
jgi:hypothetical protein